MTKTLETHNGKLRWEAILFLALYTILPTYFALELSESIPLLSASRILIVLMGIMVLLRRKDVFKLRGFQFKSLNLALSEDKLLRGGLLIYFAVLAVVNVTFLMDSEALKQLFTLVAEEYAIVWLLVMTLDSREKVQNALRILVFASGIVGILAIFSVITQWNPFHLLDTVSRYILKVSYYRMGLLRAAAGFGHPVYYGAYCAVMTPLSMYFIETTQNKKQKFFFRSCMVINMICVLLSNSRGSMLALICTAGIMFLVSMFNGKLKGFLQQYLPLLILAVVLLLIIALVALYVAPKVGPALDSFFDKLFPSTPGAVIDPTGDTVPSETTEPSQPPLEFGENANGLASRMVQLTAIPYTLSKNPLFGLGPNAFARGLVAYTYVKGHLSFVQTVDMHVVAIVGQYGLVGLLGVLAQFSAVGITMLRKKYRQDTLMYFLLMTFVCYMLCLLSISNLDRWYWIFIGIFVSYVNVLHKEHQ